MRTLIAETSVCHKGGVQEVLMLNPEKPEDVILYLKKRKGFIKLALTTGSPVVPVFGFGLDGSYGYWFPRGSLTEKISRWMGYVPLVFWGRWFIPYGIPKPQKIHIVIGKGEGEIVQPTLMSLCSTFNLSYIYYPSSEAIDVPKEGENVTQESVDKFHNIFLTELEALFERHKHEAGYANRRLRII